MTPAERERVFLELFSTHRQRLHRLCYGYLGSTQDIEDLFQEIMIHVWNGLPSFRGDSQIHTWLYRIAVNTALLFRKRRTSNERLPDLPDTASLHQDLEDRQRLASLRAAIATLPDQDRLIITLLLEGLSYKEIAEITGITVNYVGVRISRIKQTIEERITEVNHGAI